jgi:hypothetical protein
MVFLDILSGNFKGVYNRVLSALNYRHIYKFSLLSELMAVLKIVYLEISIDLFTIILTIAFDMQSNIDIIPLFQGESVIFSNS